MFIASGLPRSFWVEALNTSYYIINRCMIRPILNKTPYELFKGRKPNIMHLRIFGCKCYVHNDGKDALGKFDPRSDEVIFLSYSSHSKAYKVFNKRTLCIEESVHVMDSAKLIDTPISPSTKLVMDDGSPSVEEKTYRGMIGSLLYLTASRPNIVFSIGLLPLFSLSLMKHT